MAFLEAETHLKRLLARFYIDPTHSQTKRTHPDPIRTIFNENLKFPKTSKPFSLHLIPLQRGLDPSQKIPDIILLRINIFSSHDDPWRPHSSKFLFLISVISLPCARRGFFGSEKTAIFFLRLILICVFTKKMRAAISCRTIRSTRRELSRGVHFFKKCGSAKTANFLIFSVISFPKSQTGSTPLWIPMLGKLATGLTRP